MEKRALGNIYFNKGKGGCTIHTKHICSGKSGGGWSEVTRKQCIQFMGTNQLQKMFFGPQRTLLGVPGTPVNCDVNYSDAINLNTF